MTYFTLWFRASALLRLFKTCKREMILFFSRGIHPKRYIELNIIWTDMLNRLSIISRGITSLSSSHLLLKEPKGAMDAVHWSYQSFTTGPCMEIGGGVKCGCTEVQGPETDFIKPCLASYWRHGVIFYVLNFKLINGLISQQFLICPNPFQWFMDVQQYNPCETPNSREWNAQV